MWPVQWLLDIGQLLLLTLVLVKLVQIEQRLDRRSRSSGYPSDRTRTSAGIGTKARPSDAPPFWAHK